MSETTARFGNGRAERIATGAWAVGILSVTGIGSYLIVAADEFAAAVEFATTVGGAVSVWFITVLLLVAIGRSGVIQDVR